MRITLVLALAFLAGSGIAQARPTAVTKQARALERKVLGIRRPGMVVVASDGRLAAIRQSGSHFTLTDGATREVTLLLPLRLRPGVNGRWRAYGANLALTSDSSPSQVVDYFRDHARFQLIHQVTESSAQAPQQEHSIPIAGLTTPVKIKLVPGRNVIRAAYGTVDDTGWVSGENSQMIHIRVPAERRP